MPRSYAHVYVEWGGGKPTEVVWIDTDGDRCTALFPNEGAAIRAADEMVVRHGRHIQSLWMRPARLL